MMRLGSNICFKGDEWRRGFVIVLNELCFSGGKFR